MLGTAGVLAILQLVLRARLVREGRTPGYDVTPHLSGAFGVEQVRLNLSANNVWLLKKWVPHVHPEQSAIFGDSRMGLESTGMPITRGLGLNVNVRF